MSPYAPMLAVRMVPVAVELGTIVIEGQVTTEKEYMYVPFAGLEIVSKVYVGADGRVVATRVFVEIEGGGMSSISGDEDDED